MTDYIEEYEAAPDKDAEAPPGTNAALEAEEGGQDAAKGMGTGLDEPREEPQ